MEFITLFGTPKKKEPTVFEKIKDAVKQTKENFTEQIQHSRRVFAKRSLKHGDGCLIGPGTVGWPHLQAGENKGPD